MSGNSCSLNCNEDTYTEPNRVQECGGNMWIEINGLGSLPQNFTLQCQGENNAILHIFDPSCPYNNSSNCTVIDLMDLKFSCIPITCNKSRTNSITMTTTTMHTSSDKPSSTTPQLNTMSQPTSSGNNNIIPVLLSIIIGLMALFICIMVATMIIRKLRKRKHRYTINGHDMIQQENIYQMGDGNRRPSRIIPIVTHGGECLEMSEFPRYNDIGNHHKLSNTSLSMSCEKGGFPTDQAISMATGSYPNGRYPQEHFYSVIPANKVGHSKQESLQMKSPFPAPHDRHHPQVHTPRIHVNHSSQSSLNGDIDPYSTLDEARNEALVEIRSTHTIDEQSDDILMLNMFGSDKPKWTHDVHPLRLNVPTSRDVSGRFSRGDEDEYITMNGGHLDGGWGEVHTRFHGTGFESTDRLRQNYEDKSGFDTPEKVQYNQPMHVVSHPPQEHRQNDKEKDETPPTPDKSIEDLYAKVRKKSVQCSESSDDEVTFTVDDNESTSQRDYLIPPNPEYSEFTLKDQAIHKGQKCEEVTPEQPPLNGSTNWGERSAHIEIQAGKMSKQASGSTHTL